MNQQATALQWLADGEPAITVEVAAHRGSVPREAGTRMLVSRSAVQGTIGGGHLELQAIEHARRLLRGEPLRREQQLALGPTLGQCCGGAVTLRYTPLAECRPDCWPLSTPRFVLQLYGAGHVGRAIVHLLDGILCQVSWIDARDSEFPRQPNAPHIRRVCSESVEAEVASAPSGACHLVLTHSHALDLVITEAILKRGDFAYLGLIGSKTKRARFLHRFEARGLAPDVLSRLTCPIGVPGIVGKEPAVIAVAVVAQLLALAPQPVPAPTVSVAASQ